jgi:hypothetical protein
MTKWIIVFLALGNALLFYLVSGQVAQRHTTPTIESNAIQRIKLVTEVGLYDPDQPVGISVINSSDRSSFGQDACWMLSGIKNEKDQHVLSDFLVEQAYQPILQLPNSEFKDYRILVSDVFDQKVSDAVQRLIKERYPSVKIEKKVCKGVAY